MTGERVNGTEFNQGKIRRELIKAVGKGKKVGFQAWREMLAPYIGKTIYEGVVDCFLRPYAGFLPEEIEIQTEDGLLLLDNTGGLFRQNHGSDIKEQLGPEAWYFNDDLILDRLIELVAEDGFGKNMRTSDVRIGL